MIEQQGKMVAAADHRAVVRLGGRVGCETCDAGRGCGAGVFGRLLRNRTVELAVDNHVDAREGQAVVVGLPEAWFLSLVTRFYLYPLLAGLAGGMFGHYVSETLHFGTAVTDGVTLLAAILAGAVLILRNRRWSAEPGGPGNVHLLRVVDNDESMDDKEVIS